MNSQDMFDLIGETPERYILDAANTCHTQKSDHKYKKKRTASKLLLIAAIIGLLSATAAAGSSFLRIRIRHEESFAGDVTGSSEVTESKGGSIEFHFNIEEEISSEPIPVLEVVPYFLTEEDIKRVAYILFPDGEFYEAEPALSQNYSKAEIQEKLDRWSYYTTEEALRELIAYRPYQPDYLLEIGKNVQNFVDQYTLMLEEAPSANPHKLCDWKFKKSSVYSTPAEELAHKDTGKDNDDIKADIQVGDVHYRFSASTRNRDDFLISNINAYPYDGISPDNIGERIFRTRLCRTAPPTDEQVSAVRQKAETMLQQMQLGTWLVDECFVETKETNEYTDYIIHVNAVPVLNGTPALRKEQLTNLKNEQPGAARYYYTDVQFEFSANGDLVRFELKSPITVQKELPAHTAELDIAQQLETAKAYLSQRDFLFYSLGIPFDRMEEAIGCVVEVNGLEYNLTRINGENPLESYLYVPGVKLTGDVRYYGLETGEIHLERRNITLAVIDAENGAVVLTP